MPSAPTSATETSYFLLPVPRSCCYCSPTCFHTHPSPVAPPREQTKSQTLHSQVFWAVATAIPTCFPAPLSCQAGACTQSPEKSVPWSSDRPRNSWELSRGHLRSSVWTGSIPLPALRGTQASDVQTPWGQKTGGTEGKALCGGSVLLPSSEYLGGSGHAIWLKRVVWFSKPW